jgi:hypothetical protein
MNIDQIIALAIQHEGTDDSAILAREDAQFLLTERQHVTSAYDRALTSLRHSVGVFHPDYKRAATGLSA